MFENKRPPPLEASGETAGPSGGPAAGTAAGKRETQKPSSAERPNHEATRSAYPRSVTAAGYTT